MTTMVALETRDWVEEARALAPVVERWRDVGEQERRMPTPLFEALRDAGLFRISVPRALGGEELDDESTLRVIEELSRQDGAVGWNVMIASNAVDVARRLPAPVLREIYRDGPNAVVAGSLRPIAGNVAVPVEGGYRVNGRWPLASGCQHAAWLAGACFVMHDGAPRMQADGMPELRVAFWPSAESELLDTWYTTGMRGTGSHDFQASEVVVPDQYSLGLSMSGPDDVGVLSLRYFSARGGPQIVAVGLGIARAAIDAFMKLATTKTPHGGLSTLASAQTVHEKVGRAEALLRSARAYLYEIVRESMPYLARSEAVSDELSAAIRLASAHTAQSAAEAVDLMFAAGGISSTYTSSRLDRCFRDVHMVTQHVLVAPSNIEMVGQYLLGFGLQMRR
jgi:alkylation response protein AidB-like acyl-CoA dehydrogenase